MGRRERAARAVQPLLEPGEVVFHLDFAQFKPAGEAIRTGAKVVTGVAASMAASAALSLLGPVGMHLMAKPRLVWVVVTSHRLLMFTKEDSYRKPVGDLLFAKAMGAVRMESKKGIRGQLYVLPTAGGYQPDLMLNFGVRRRAATAMALAVNSV